jgi:hypothetical protein
MKQKPRSTFFHQLIEVAERIQLSLAAQLLKHPSGASFFFISPNE